MNEIYVRKREGRKIKRKYKIISTAIILIVAVLFTVRYVNVKLDPLVCDLAYPQVIGMMNEIINEATTHVLSHEKYKGRECFTVYYAENGRISSVQVNTSFVNLIRADIAAYTYEKLRELEEYNIYISLSNLFDDEIFWARFPELKMSAGVTPSGGVETDTESEFTSGGLNQTHYRMYITVSVVVHAQMLISTMEIKSATKVCMAECVIVGDVPQFYLGGSTPVYE